MAEIQVTYSSENQHQPQVRGSQAAFELLMGLYDLKLIELREEFKVLYLNKSNRVIGFQDIGVGSLAGVLVHTSLLFGTAMKVLATGIILCHNHPSGNLKVSQADRDMTRRFEEIAKLHEMAIIDHLIITKEGYTSFADEGWL